ncbi:probable basic-leucine zipper transcription factor Q isoform X2 [Rhagoletis pomonella]|uniref:probable basic-leucine zipper transcription factor Q isoform X2 n=1 Tax=Rhagoletis pomonella TaxID=28610 RepID=UPI001780497D|nr:probable basic-leucine zipper transcription factor Q isoform X2 [Rhagoletis pomonella]XP_036339518.1 probable basic-leucine zipper transcription factor Q isoform X2 [Rhagoletis pomonella]XP_036339519.1 probable basic-leucine zipper transcription factor Q isoform X2 [Rhagoletis pomonella]XP_036339520.1 probable basic-leucine zipper transcription factor Q isoform X2 [Rhagoletis pomonella]
MVAIEHRQKSSTAATATATATSATTINIAVLSPTSSASSASAASNTTTTTTSSIQQQQQQQQQQEQQQQSHKSLEEKKQLVEEVLKSNPKSPIQKQLSKTDKMSQLESPADTKNAEKQQQNKDGGAVSKSAVSQRNVDIKISKKSNLDAATKELTKKVLKLDLTGKDLDEFSIKSPKSPIARLPHQTSLTSSVDVEDRKTLREALYQGIFHRHRRTIFAVGSFLRMLRSRNSQYNTIRSSSEGEDVDEVR